MSTTRVTLSLDHGVVERTRLATEGNLSRLVSRLLQDYLDELERKRLQEELRLGYLAEAETDLEITREYELLDRESARFEDA